jgi:hypothetical protein
MTSKAIQHELPAIPMGQIRGERHDRLPLCGAILSFSVKLAARVLAAHRARQVERVERIRRAGLAAMD